MMFFTFVRIFALFTRFRTSIQCFKNQHRASKIPLMEAMSSEA